MFCYARTSNTADPRTPVSRPWLGGVSPSPTSPEEQLSRSTCSECFDAWQVQYSRTIAEPGLLRLMMLFSCKVMIADQCCAAAE